VGFPLQKNFFSFSTTAFQRSKEWMSRAQTFFNRFLTLAGPAEHRGVSSGNGYKTVKRGGRLYYP